ncbi:MAG: hypothetical protein ACREJ3_17560 [Polyangiaceae bacterium]
MVFKTGRGALGAPVLAGIMTSVALAGCAAVLGIDDNRHLTEPDAGAGNRASDAGGEASPEGGPWSCVSNPPEVTDPSMPIDLTLDVMDALQPSVAAGSIDGGSDLDTVSGTFLAGVSVRACALLDPECANASTPIATGDAGTAEFHLTGAFSGFFALSRSDLIPVTLYPGNMLTGQTVVSFPSYDLTPSGLQLLASSVSSMVTPSLDPHGTLGHALIQIYDCADHQGAGVSLAYSASGPQTTAFYFKGGLPTLAARETDSYGLGGAINLPSGSITVTGSLKDGTSVGSTTFNVRPGAVTFAWIRVRSH